METRVEGLPVARMPSPTPPGGTMNAESPYYIERRDAIADYSIDPRAMELASLKLKWESGITFSIQAPRQFGKSSLLARIALQARSEGRPVAAVDLTLFDCSRSADESTFYQAFTADVVRSLGLAAGPSETWPAMPSNAAACTLFFQHYIFPAAPNLLLALDEVEVIAETDFGIRFFAMLRVWNNLRTTLVPAGVSLCLITATEPSLLVVGSQSPFNVGPVLRLRDFTEEESSELYRRYGSPVNTAVEREFFHLLEGHPYLTHIAAYYLASGTPAKMLLEPRYWENSPFSDHLRYFAFRISDKRSLTETFRLARKGKFCESNSFMYLFSMGLVEGTNIQPRVRREIYRRFYKGL